MPRARHWQLDPNFRTNPSGSRHGGFVPKGDIAKHLVLISTES